MFWVLDGHPSNSRWREDSDVACLYESPGNAWSSRKGSGSNGCEFSLTVKEPHQFTRSGEEGVLEARTRRDGPYEGGTGSRSLRIRRVSGGSRETTDQRAGTHREEVVWTRRNQYKVVH